MGYDLVGVQAQQCGGAAAVLAPCMHVRRVAQVQNAAQHLSARHQRGFSDGWCVMQWGART